MPESNGPCDGICDTAAVTESDDRTFADGCTLPVVVRRPVHLDRMEMPCVDCHVGEPHVCRLLSWGTVTIRQDEWGGYVFD